ncbi:MAG: hypothetical protein EON58_14190 [Alphaproteobacteria bacterium]|nr:MAG: hypothetical protein EON58_14190 [Alphaproteobacteria bacterium]
MFIPLWTLHDCDERGRCADLRLDLLPRQSSAEAATRRCNDDFIVTSAETRPLRRLCDWRLSNLSIVFGYFDPISKSVVSIRAVKQRWNQANFRGYLTTDWMAVDLVYYLWTWTEYLVPFPWIAQHDEANYRPNSSAHWVPNRT